jgi:hypothetical protein
MADTDRMGRALDLVDRADARGASLRMVGGIAITYLCGGEVREADLDFVAGAKDRGAIQAAFTDAGFGYDVEFNHLHGHKRLYFESADGLSVDVFMGQMDMCHTLDMRHRLQLTRPTVTPADLLLSKLQIVEFTDKDRGDTQTLLERLEVAERDDAIDPRRIDEVTCADWGWHRTVSDNLARFRDGAGVAHDNAKALLELIDSSPKSRKWNLRARVGTRRKWYRLPEEVAHGSLAGGG